MDLPQEDIGKSLFIGLGELFDYHNKFLSVYLQFLKAIIPTNFFQLDSHVQPLGMMLEYDTSITKI